MPQEMTQLVARDLLIKKKRPHKSESIIKSLIKLKRLFSNNSFLKYNEYY